MNVLRLGTMGPDVVAWLAILSASPAPTVWTNSKGVTKTWSATNPWPLPTSFSFDKVTEDATEAWQFAHGLEADGVVGPITWSVANSPITVSPPFPLVKGLDSSVIQGKLPIATMLAEDLVFGWARCKVGNNAGRDIVFEETMRAYHDAGIIRGGYVFPFPLKHLVPIEQAKMFLEALLIDGNVVGTSLGELPIAFDLEWPPPEQWAKYGCTPDQIVDWSLACLEYMWKQTGSMPVIYSYPYFLQSISKAKNYAQLVRYKLWLAGGPQYDHGNGSWPDLQTYKLPVVPGWGSDWTFNQCDGNGGRKLANGVDADFNIFRYDFAALEQFCQVQVTTVPDLLPDLNTMMQATSNLIVEDSLHAFRQERAEAFILQPT